MKSTENYFKQIERLKNVLDISDAVIIGAGAGLSTSAGFTYSGERFDKYFSDFQNKYGFTDLYLSLIHIFQYAWYNSLP